MIGRASDAKAQKKSCGDYMISKHDFQALEKLTHHLSDGMKHGAYGPRERTWVAH